MKLMVCDQPSVTAENVVTCSSWQVVDLESLVKQEQFLQLMELFEFDLATFGLITGGLLLTFIFSHTGGLVVKRMNRT